jgi:nicotinate-nucleotide--dimethylbenzimidazole phosphoribosyltransferase
MTQFGPPPKVASAPPGSRDFRFPRIPDVDPFAAEWLWGVMDQKTKPPRSLGRLEELAVRFVSLRAERDQAVIPLYRVSTISKSAIVVAAADHGIADEGVSAYPQKVTEQMLLNFESGGAAINALCKAIGAELFVVDVGTRRDGENSEDGSIDLEPATKRVAISTNPVRQWRVRAGSGNMTRGFALTLSEVQQAVNLGLNLAVELDHAGITVVGLGEMGIGNSTVAAILTAVFCNVNNPAERAELVGRGTGVDDAGLERKRSAVERALALHNPNPADPWRVMTQVGGLEIALLAGVAIGAASRRIAVVLDGFISTAAALVAHAWCPAVQQYLFASHRSVEPGHRVALQHLSLQPYLDLELRLGEGSGAALVLPLFNAASAIYNDMASFDSAGVSGAL